MVKVILIDLDYTFWKFNSFDAEYKNLKQLRDGLYTESLECVHLLKQKGYIVGFASASYDNKICRKYINMLFPPNYIDFIIIVPTFPTKKNHYKYVSLKFNTQYKDMVMIDDSREILIDASAHGLNIIDAGKTGLTKEIIKHLL